MIRREHREEKWALPFVEYLPSVINRKLPLIIQLHGAGERGDGSDLSLVDGVLAISNGAAPSAAISGAGTLRKEGDTSWTLSSAQENFSGDFVLAGGYNFLTANGVFGNDTGRLVVTNGASPIDIHGGRMTTVTGCNIVRIAEGHSAIPVNIGGGQGVTIVGNTIATRSGAVTLASGFKGAANITGNTILTASTTDKMVINNLAKNAAVNTEGNVISLNQKFD